MKNLLLCLVISFCAVLSSLAQGVGIDNARIEPERTGGSAPLVDITKYGARMVPSVPNTTATISKGAATAILASPSSFRNGDGVTILGAGKANTLSAPGAPIVTPSVATGGTTTGIVTDSPAGKSRYSYKIVARDRYGALTAAGTATTVITGQSSLGLRTASITSASRSDDSVTISTSERTLLVVGALIHITGTSNPDFDGWFIVGAVNTEKQFVIRQTSFDSRGIGWKFGDTSTSSGGTIAFYLSNHLKWMPVADAWEYYIYGERPGETSYNLIGQTRPSADGWVEAQFDDYGAAFMADQSFPVYVPLIAPSTASNDPLTTTIVAGGGSKKLTLSAAAMNPVSGSIILLDDAPAIAAAAEASRTVGDTLYIPPSPGGFFPINSFLLLPVGLNIKQSGALYLYETVEVQSNTNWLGDWGNSGEPQFGFVGPAGVSIVTANPGIYAHGNGIDSAYVSWNSSGTNGGTLWIVQDSVNAEWDYCNFVTNNVNNSDYIGTNIVFRSTSTGGNHYHFRKTLFSSGPNQLSDKSWTPLIYFPPNQNGSGGLLQNQNYSFRCMECFFNRRGIEEEQDGGSVGRFEFDGGYRQGGITPFLMMGNGNGTVTGSVIFSDVVQDTENVGTLALLAYAAGSFAVSVDASSLNNNSSDVNGTPPPFTGYRLGSVREFGSFTGDAPNRTTELSVSPCAVTYPYATVGTGSCVTDSMKKMLETMDFPAKHSLFWDLATPSEVKSGPAINGGSLAVSTTYYYTVSAIGVDGGETVPAAVASSSTTSRSNRTILVSWTGVAGAVAYNLYRCTLSCVSSDGRIVNSGGWRVIDRMVTATGVADKGLGVGQGPPTATGTGSVGANATEVYAPAFVTVSPLSNGRSYTATDRAPITANRTYIKPDQSGTYVLGLTGSTTLIEGALLKESCVSGVARVTGALVGMPVLVSTADGSDVGGAFNVRASVTSNGTVTVYVCGTGKPAAKTYNVRVIQ